MNQAIIHSLLDTDLYKFTMMQVVLHQFPGAQVEYAFRCRTAGVDLRPIADALNQQIDALCALRFQEHELAYLRSLRYLKPDFVDFLRVFQLDRRYLTVQCNQQLELTIRGPWLHTILFEVPLLALINELYFRLIAPNLDLSDARNRLAGKIELVAKHPDRDRFRFSDFGTRRRFASHWQDELIGSIKQSLPKQFTGTSNVYFAMKHGLTAIGTMAHEYLQAFQALGPRLIDSQKAAFEAWAKEYRGDLGIALSDVVGMDAFLRDFDLYFCKLFDGARHDSGDPFVWGEKLLQHYQNLRIAAQTKTMVFSDGLTIPKALSLHERFIGRCLPKFGVGTNLTCDVGPTPINIVLKMTRCNGQPVAKLSDEPGKTMCDDPVYLAYLRQVFSAPKNSVEKSL